MANAPDGFVQVEADSSALPYLSYSRVNRYLLCPEQYRLYYVEGMRPAVPPASLEFGSAVHRSLAAHFTAGKDPVAVFTAYWANFQEAGLRYSYRETWDSLNERGQRLLAKFVEEELPRIRNVEACEKPFELMVSNMDTPLVGVIDLVAEVDGERCVVDFKTAAQKYQDYEVALSDQLTAYHLAVPSVSDFALCVLVKTKEPRIDWYRAERNGEDLVAFLAKSRYVGQAIHAGPSTRGPANGAPGANSCLFASTGERPAPKGRGECRFDSSEPVYVIYWLLRCHAVLVNRSRPRVERCYARANGSS